VHFDLAYAWEYLKQGTKQQINGFLDIFLIWEQEGQ
jgi:hypothetical protein